MWKYDGLNQWALHVESQTRFGIRHGKKLVDISDFELIPPDGEPLRWPSADLAQMKLSLWEEMKRVWAQNALRNRLQSLIQLKLRGDNYRAANVISGISGKSVSARSIQAWLIEPTKRSHRTCPEWAVSALESYTPPEQERTPETSSPLSAWDIKTRYGVRFAEQAIEADERLRQGWLDAPASSIPLRLYELERQLTDHLYYLNENFSAIRTALKSSDSFVEFRKQVLEKLEEAADIRFFIGETKKAIEQRGEEFANPHGLPNPKGSQA